MQPSVAWSLILPTLWGSTYPSISWGEVANYATGRSKLIQDAFVAPLYNRIAKDLITHKRCNGTTGKQVPIPGQFMDSPAGVHDATGDGEKPVTQGVACRYTPPKSEVPDTGGRDGEECHQYWGQGLCETP